MVKWNLLFAAFLLVTIGVVAQAPHDTINRDHLNHALIEQLFLQELNQLRQANHVGALQADNTLLKAADDQAAYCRQQSKVTHYQAGVNQKYEPKNRVRYYGGNYGTVGENALMTFLFQRYTDTKTQKQVTIYTYQQLAHQLFEQWKNSPEHYVNMLLPTYSKTGLALALDANKTVLYAVEVFGSAPYYPPHNGLHYTDSTYGIAEYEPGKCKTFGQNDFLAQIFSSYFITEGDSIFMYYQEEKTIRNMLIGEHDGLAVDIVYKNQFKCMEPDNLHPSTIFDGYLLPPVYRDELFKNDRYKNSEFKSFVGKIPANAPRKDMQLNAVVIQNGMACRYSFPVAIEYGILPDIAIDPQWCKAQGNIKKDSVSLVKEFQIPFEKSETTTSNFYFEKLTHLLHVFDGAITKIEITSYSSVEGWEANNLELQKNRGNFIEKFINDRLHNKIKIEKQSIENWLLFFEQIKGTPYELMFADSNKENIRTEVNKRMHEPRVEEWLFDERVASIKLYINKEYDNDVPANFLPLALYNSIEKQDTDQARIAYSRIIEAYEKGEIDRYFLTAVEIPLQKKYLPLISNYLASILIESDIFNYRDFSGRYYEYIDSAKRMFSSFKPLAFNLSVYKTHLYFRNMVNGVPDFKKIESDVLKFKKDTSINQQVLDHLMYNYYLTASIYYEKLHMFEDMYTAFEKVKPYLSLAALKEDEVYKVGKYFNYFFRFNETIELVEKYLKKYPDNEDLTFLYVATGAIYNLNIHYHEEEYYRQLDKLAKMNRARLCKWLNENYQLIRDENFEKKACSYCSLN